MIFTWKHRCSHSIALGNFVHIYSVLVSPLCRADRGILDSSHHLLQERSLHWNSHLQLNAKLEWGIFSMNKQDQFHFNTSTQYISKKTLKVQVIFFLKDNFQV